MTVPSYGEMEDKISINEYAQGKQWEPGGYSHDIEVGFRGSETYFIKDEETDRGLVMPYVLAHTVAEEIGMDLEMKYDENAGKVIRPEVDGVPTDEYIPGVTGFFNRLVGRPIGPEPEELYEASVLKYFIADDDVGPNILVNEDNAEPIDFHRAGNLGEHFYSQFLDRLEDAFGHLNRNFSQREFERVVNDYTEQANLEVLEEDLREGFNTHGTFRTEKREDSAIDRTLENFKRFK
jgi:hypothetical protein